MRSAARRRSAAGAGKGRQLRTLPPVCHRPRPRRARSRQTLRPQPSPRAALPARARGAAQRAEALEKEKWHPAWPASLQSTTWRRRMPRRCGGAFALFEPPSMQRRAVGEGQCSGCRAPSPAPALARSGPSCRASEGGRCTDALPVVSCVVVFAMASARAADASGGMANLARRRPLVHHCLPPALFRRPCPPPPL